MLQNQARGSPMPNPNPLPPQPTQAAQHPGMAQQYNFATMQYRPPGQDQQQHQMIMPQYQMYPYPMSYAMPGGRLQPGYPQWGVGRGMPNQAQVNGQAAVGMQQQQQLQMQMQMQQMQMQMAVGKPTQGTGR